MKIYLTPPTPTPTSTQQQQQSTPSPNDTAALVARQLQVTLALFNEHYNTFVTMKHSTHVSSSLGDPEQSICLEIERLKDWMFKSMAFIINSIPLEQIPPETYEIITKTKTAALHSLSNIESRIKALRSYPSIDVDTIDTNHEEDDNKRLSLSSISSSSSPPSSPKKRPTSFNNNNNNNVRLSDDKQSRDCIRRIVVTFYLRDYLQIKIQHSVPDTFKDAAAFITCHTDLFTNHITEFIKARFPVQMQICPSIVDMFISHCQREMLAIISYLTYLLKQDANEYNYDGTCLAVVPNILMKRIRIRLVQDKTYDSLACYELNKDFTNIKNTALGIFSIVNSRSLIHTNQHRQQQQQQQQQSDVDSDDETQMLDEHD